MTVFPFTSTLRLMPTEPAAFDSRKEPHNSPTAKDNTGCFPGMKSIYTDNLKMTKKNRKMHLQTTISKKQ